MHSEGDRSSDSSVFSYQRMLFRYRYAKKFLKKGPVLDIACGYGYAAGMFARYGYYGIDYDGEAVRIAREKSRGAGRFVVMKAQSLGFRDEVFSTVICCEVIEHLVLHEAPALIAEAYRVLKKGGIMILSTPNADKRINRWPSHLKEYSVGEMHALIRASGFSVVRRGGVSVDILHNRYDNNNPFTIARRKIYTLIAARPASTSNDAQSSTGPTGAESPFLAIAKRGLKIFLVGFAKVLNYAGYLLPRHAEYQIWVLQK